jgi:hypothetical protein
MNARPTFSTLLAALAAASFARAADKPAAPATAKPSTPTTAAKPATPPAASAQAAEEDYAHGGQFDLRLEIVTGYKMLFRYDKSPRCAPYDYSKIPKDQQKFCGFGAAPQFGAAVGFSPIGFFEPFAFARLGLTSGEAERTNMGKAVIAGAGARLYTMSDAAFKFFFSPWVGFDWTSGPVDPLDDGDAKIGIVPGAYRTDFLVGLGIGPQYDISKYFGVYMSGGLTFGVLRSLGATADLSFGIQLRAP